jgi:hypothetical protein
LERVLKTFNLHLIRSFHKLIERLNLDIMNKINDIRKLADMEKNKKEKEEFGKLLKYAEKSGITAHHTNCHHKISFKNAKVVQQDNNRQKLELLRAGQGRREPSRAP